MLVIYANSLISSFKRLTHGILILIYCERVWQLPELLEYKKMTKRIKQKKNMVLNQKNCAGCKMHDARNSFFLSLASKLSSKYCSIDYNCLNPIN